MFIQFHVKFFNYIEFLCANRQLIVQQLLFVRICFSVFILHFSFPFFKELLEVLEYLPLDYGLTMFQLQNTL